MTRMLEALAEVEAADQAVTAAQELVSAAAERRSAAVRAALLAGVPVRVVADTLGVSRGRVYQLRDGSR